MSFFNDPIEDYGDYGEMDIHDDYLNDASNDNPLFMMGQGNFCPCPSRNNNLLHGRHLEDAPPPGSDAETWEVVVTVVVLIGMFVALIGDYAGADSVMLAALTIYMATGIVAVSPTEGLKGFSNEGLLTVLVLFVVADGISKTGALDWYMGKLLGRPKSIGSAQARLMLPISFVSAFLNNTPVVAVMIPIVQKWGKNIKVSPQKLLIPLSFASIFGGTCTLIGTSTNLIVKGLLEDRYPGDPSVAIGLFDLGVYGVPVAFVGMTYVLLFSPCLLPYGGGKSAERSGNTPLEDNEDILLGARLTQWSPAAGRTVKRSGLRDTGGIYLVSVHRYVTGNVHRAVGQDFVLNAGDILYFTGLVEEFGAFCEEHGLEMITNEIEDTIRSPKGGTGDPVPVEEGLPEDVRDMVGDNDHTGSSNRDIENGDAEAILPSAANNGAPLPTVLEDDDKLADFPIEIGVTKESLLQADSAERLRSITRMTDMIRKVDRDESQDLNAVRSPRRRQASIPLSDAPKVIVTVDRDLVVVGVDSRDRPGLLLDLSKGLHSLGLQFHHTEASVINNRSLSIWRCEPMGTEIADVEHVWKTMTVSQLPALADLFLYTIALFTMAIANAFLGASGS